MNTAASDAFERDGRRFLRLEGFDPQRPDAAFSIAETLGDRYRIGSILAVGDLTVLLHATDLRTRHEVVIKAIRSDVFEGIPPGPDALIEAVRHARHSLQTERRLLVRLRNAGLAQVPNPNDYLFEPSPAWKDLLPDAMVKTEPYLVLEKRSGRTLEALLAEESPEGLDPTRALRMIRPILKVLATLHEPWRLASGRTWHCLYSDLKPSNILVDVFDRPTLLDFGGCQVIVDGVPVLAGACTDGYAPPEASNRGPARPLLACADVYTVGSTLRQMITGISPFDPRWGQPLAKALESRRVPARVGGLLARCLATRPSERFADAVQVDRAIEALLQNPR